MGPNLRALRLMKDTATPNRLMLSPESRSPLRSETLGKERPLAEVPVGNRRGLSLEVVAPVAVAEPCRAPLYGFSVGGVGVGTGERGLAPFTRSWRRLKVR